MADRPILFSAPMVRALLAGTKTQTRRVLKPQPVCHVGAVPSFSWGRYGGLYPDDWFGYGSEIDGALPYRPGGRLWVREAWKTSVLYDATAPRDIPVKAAPVYFTSDDRLWQVARYRPGIHMPRWASRLTLLVTDVRVQRLQGISEDDAIAEGLTPAGVAGWVVPELGDDSADLNPVAVYRTLWDSINGAGAWDTNPWVAVYGFSVEHRNIDAEVRHDL